MTTTHTKREFYEAIKGCMETGDMSIIPEEVIAFCDKEIAALDRKAEKARENAAKKKAEGDKLTDLVRAALTENFQITADIAAAIPTDETEVSIAKVQYRLNQLISLGEAEKTDMSIGEAGSKRTLKAYRRIVTD